MYTKDIDYEFENVYDDFVNEMQLTKESLVKARVQKKKIEEDEQASRTKKAERLKLIERFSKSPKIKRY